uniref:Outer envelope protein 80ic isoform X2 n=1 Tax=Rhizophora mucronata TaxID=61149 RepID=A0A2P2KXW0_RHIMU
MDFALSVHSATSMLTMPSIHFNKKPSTLASATLLHECLKA